MKPASWWCEQNTWNAVSALISILALGSYLVFYVTVPKAYEVGPAVLFLLAIVNFGVCGRRLWPEVDADTKRMLWVFVAYFVAEASMLLLHGEDVSEFDLSTRLLAAAGVMVFLLNCRISVAAFFVLVALGGIVTGLHAVYQSEWVGMSRVRAFDNPIHYGNGALGLALISLAGVVWGRKQPGSGYWVVLLLVGIAGGTYASLVSGTRSGWIAVPAAAFVGLLVYWNKLMRVRWLIPLALLLSTLFVVSVSQLDLVERRSAQAVDQFDAYFEEGRNDTSVGLRLDMWKAGWAAFSESPLVGLGPAGKDKLVRDMVESVEINPQVEEFRHLHNQYVDCMARYGLVGLLAYLALLIVPFSLFLRKARSRSPNIRSLGLAGALFVAANAVVNLTQSMLERNIGIMMFVFMIVFIWVVLVGEEKHAALRESEAGN